MPAGPVVTAACRSSDPPTPGPTARPAACRSSDPPTPGPAAGAVAGVKAKALPCCPISCVLSERDCEGDSYATAAHQKDLASGAVSTLANGRQDHHTRR